MKNNGITATRPMAEEFLLARDWINRAFREGVFSYEERITYSSARAIVRCAARNELLSGVREEEAICILFYSSGYLQGMIDGENGENEQLA